MSDVIAELDANRWFRDGRGPRYQQLSRHVGDMIRSGVLSAEDPLPSERDFAEHAGVSRVTVRKAMAELATAGLIEQRHGSGSFVRTSGDRFEQSLSSLVSFTENLQARGITSSSKVLLAGLFRPTPTEITILGLTPVRRAARVHRLRYGDGVPMALEHSTLPDDVLPRPETVTVSLYEALRARHLAPARAIQRVTAVNASERVADHLKLAEGTAVLQIERTGYLASGRPIEFSSGFYRSDIYDFLSELRLD